MEAKTSEKNGEIINTLPLEKSCKSFVVSAVDHLICLFLFFFFLSEFCCTFENSALRSNDSFIILIAIVIIQSRLLHPTYPSSQPSFSFFLN